MASAQLSSAQLCGTRLQSSPTCTARGLAAITLCIFLGLVGVFPVDQFHPIRTEFASGMMVALAVLVTCLSGWIPEMSRPFVRLG